MLQIAFYLSCGATACYLWGRSIKREADSFSNITRVVDFKRLDELLKEKATNLLVVVSGKVASATTLGALFKAKAEWVMRPHIATVRFTNLFYTWRALKAFV